MIRKQGLGIPRFSSCFLCCPCFFSPYGFPPFPSQYQKKIRATANYYHFLLCSWGVRILHCFSIDVCELCYPWEPLKNTFKSPPKTVKNTTKHSPNSPKRAPNIPQKIVRFSQSLWSGDGSSKLSIVYRLRTRKILGNGMDFQNVCSHWNSR